MIMNSLFSFKCCSKCGTVWEKRADFINDKSLRINGYLANFDRPESGLYLFTHDKVNCKSTFVLPVADFSSLYQGIIYQACNKGKENCPLRCIDLQNLQECGCECSMAWIRIVLQCFRIHFVENDK